MALKKGQGVSKGKRPAKKFQSKRPAIEISESKDEGSMDDQRIIWEQLVALERAHGLSPGGPGVVSSRARGHMT